MSLIHDGLPDLLRNLRKLQKKEILVGVPRDTSERKQTDVEEMNNATLAFIHEHGSPLANIPARPFIGPGIKRNKDKITKFLKKAGEAALTAGGRDKVEQQLNLAGMAAQNGARAVINDGEGFQELAPSTIYQRQQRGRTGTKPLIDTGQLRNSITYVFKED